MKISYSLLSDSGPRQQNEDSLDCWTTNTGATIACVADGLGGMGGGKTASGIAVHEIKSYFEVSRISPEHLLEAAWRAHREIREAQIASEKGPLANMATTLTVAVISGKDLIGIHCGDSRAAIARNHGIKKLTVDHSEGQRLFDSGKLSKKEFFAYERKHILESALGDKSQPRIDQFSFPILAGDRVILTTDGVHNIVPLKEMQRLSSISTTPTDLTDEVSSLIREAGAADNFSMVALFVS